MFKPGVPMEQLFQEVYRVPSASNLRSVDSYYVDENKSIWLIQITKDVDHKVNSLGIIELLKMLGELEGFADGTTQVKLVFVVPLKLFDMFPLQAFWSPAVFDAELSDEDLYKSTCDVIPGIKENKKRKLNERNIRTVEDVLEAKRKNPDSISFVKSKVADFEEQLQLRAHLAKVESLQQIVLGLPVENEVSKLLAEVKAG
eukprot:CAMPEP_0118713236 /NCGR_PEP_ID=MMETSP0800-20121206/25378_1 /TAXON_ID=210618 ORGANISM="Striatella unipunctata, Strain CCMP2910" /NCGR_SAMPLE_ID=MMETSP0800 /ASSEMBLY_ACC=CAM_ASM_000638 /LENGTH=200 /DNA_ID=CAMNT_0006618613 /DNA_START=125 /DNA_END=727 /DNA_ORIENTATION=-